MFVISAYCLLYLHTTGKLEEEKYTVYCNTEMEAGATKRVAKALVDCKVYTPVIYMHTGRSVIR